MDPRLREYLATPARQARVVGETRHRPWPLPQGPWVLAQTWDDLLFAHWRVPREQLAPLVPEGLELDEPDGSAWLGITPFRIARSRVRGTLPAPWVSSFLECNCRTYVTRDGKPGIWFFSLDCESELAVAAARRLYRLPYFRARMSATPWGEGVDFASARRESEPPAVLHVRYAPAGDAQPAAPGTLEHSLTERYCLYTAAAGRLLRAEVHHPPWPLQPARAEVELNSLPPAGVELEGEPLLHFSRRQDVVIWPLQAV